MIIHSDNNIHDITLFDEENQLWRLELLSDPSIHATTELIPIDYPLGSRVWNVSTPVFNGNLGKPWKSWKGT